MGRIVLPVCSDLGIWCHGPLAAIVERIVIRIYAAYITINEAERMAKFVCEYLL